MIGTVDVRVTAGHPNMPLCPVAVFAGSAATIGVRDVPRTRCGATITGVRVAIENVDGTAVAVAAELRGGVWCATFGESHFASPGRVSNGLTITAVGLDSTGTPESWIIGRGDVEVLSADSVPAAGETMQYIRYRDSVPEDPRPGDLAAVDGAWCVYTASGWMKLGGGMKVDGEFDMDCTDGEMREKLAKLWKAAGGAVKATATAIALLCLSALGEEPGAPGVMKHGNMKPTMYVSTNVWATVSNRVDALAKKHADATEQRLQGDIGSKVDAGKYEADEETRTLALASMARDIAGKADASTLSGYTPKSDFNSATNALQSAIDGKQNTLDPNGHYDISVRWSSETGYAYEAAHATGALSATNDSDDNNITQTYATKTALAAVSNDVASFVTFWSGDDVRDTVTNYDSQVHLPSRYLEQKKPPDADHPAEWFRVVWDEMTRWNWFLDGAWASVTNHVTQNLADRAWGVYDSSTGNYSPDGVLQISQSMVQFADGMAWQKTVTTGGGALWVLTANQPLDVSGVTSNGFFKISDADGAPLFEIVKGDKRIVGATAANLVMGSGNAMTITYNVVSDDHPTLSVCTDLKAADWSEVTPGAPSAFASVAWSGQSGAWVATVQPIPAARPQLFVNASYETGGNTYIKNHVASSMDKIVVGGVEYGVKVETHTIGGVAKKILVLE